MQQLKYYRSCCGVFIQDINTSEEDCCLTMLFIRTTTKFSTGNGMLFTDTNDVYIQWIRRDISFRKRHQILDTEVA